MDIQTPSKQKIIVSTIALLSAKNLKNVKVSDIIAGSGVSHQTFYRIFMDKYDACEYAAYHLLSNARLVVGDNATVQAHTMCTLNIIKTNDRFFRHLFADDEGIEIMKKTLAHLSRDSISVNSEPPILASWIFCIRQWSQDNYHTPTEEVYYQILRCYPIGQVVFGDELMQALAKYGSYTMGDLNSSINPPKKSDKD